MTHFPVDSLLDDGLTTAFMDVDVSEFDPHTEQVLIDYVRTYGYPKGMEAIDLKPRLWDAEDEVSPARPTVDDVRYQVRAAQARDRELYKALDAQRRQNQMEDDIRVIREHVTQGNPIVNFVKRHPFLAGFFAADLYERTIGRDK